MEMTHRSPEFEEILFRAERNLRQLMAIPEEYAVIFLQGGGSLQFTMVPMNLCMPGKTGGRAAYRECGRPKRSRSLKKAFLIRLAASTEAEKFTRVPRKDEITLAAGRFLRVHGVEQHDRRNAMERVSPDWEVPLVADMSSDIASRRMDVGRFGLIFAGAQKNLGPSGVTVMIVRRDLAERADKTCQRCCNTEQRSKSARCFIRRRRLRCTSWVLCWNGSPRKAEWRRLKSEMKRKPECSTTRLMPAAFILVRCRKNRART